jgi:hypothetical protein
MTKLHTAVFRIGDYMRLSADEIAVIGTEIMATRLPLLRRLSVNEVMWEVGDVLSIHHIFLTWFAD